MISFLNAEEQCASSQFVDKGADLADWFVFCGCREGHVSTRFFFMKCIATSGWSIRNYFFVRFPYRISQHCETSYCSWGCVLPSTCPKDGPLAIFFPFINAIHGSNTQCIGGQWGTLPMRVFSNLDQPTCSIWEKKHVCADKATASATRVGHPICGAYFVFCKILSNLQNQACALARAKSTRSRSSLAMMFG